MISYWKTQWFNLLIGFVNLGVSISYVIREDYIWFVAWLITALVWLIMSRVDYNNDRIELLEKKAELYDALVEKVEALQKLQEATDKLNSQRFKKLEGKNDGN